MVVGIFAAEVFEIRKTFNTLTDEEEAKDLKLKTIPVLAEEATKHGCKSTELHETVAEDESSAAVIKGFQKKVLAVQKASAELLPVVKKCSRSTSGRREEGPLRGDEVGVAQAAENVFLRGYGGCKQGTGNF